MARIKRQQCTFKDLPVFAWWFLISTTLSACASNEQLFSEYRSDFCVELASERIEWEPAVYFDTDQFTLSDDAIETLDNNLMFLLAFPSKRVSIRGFTDKHATVLYNNKLSEKRADSVVSYLRNKGIDQTRISVHALGESIAQPREGLPVSDDISRRVEMILLDLDGWPAVVMQSLSRMAVE